MMRDTVRRSSSWLAALGPALAAMLLSSPPAGAQAVGGLVVTAATRRPLGGVVAGIVDTAGRWVAATRADSTGAFFIDAPQAGRYQVVLVPAPGRLYNTPSVFVGPDSVVQHAYPVPDSTADRTVYLAREVTDSAQFRRDSSLKAHYPPALAERGVRGSVSVLFVVGADGRPEPSTAQTLGATDAAFAAAVTDALRDVRFTPAQLDGHSVRQLRALTVAFGFEGDALHADVEIRRHAGG